MEDSFAGLRELLRVQMQVLVRELQEDEHSQQPPPPYQSGAVVVDADAPTTTAPSSQRKRTQTGTAFTSPGREDPGRGTPSPLAPTPQPTQHAVSGSSSTASKALVVYTGMPEGGSAAPDVVLEGAQFLRASPLAGEVRGDHFLAVENSEPVLLESLASTNAQHVQEELAPQATLVTLSLPTPRTELGPCEWCGGSEWQQRESDGCWLCRCYFALVAQRAA
jgi:hypothetical protein